MKRRVILLVIGFLLGITLALGCQAAAAPEGVPEADTYHWLLTAGEDAYILCDGGQFVVTVNGADSIYIQCIPSTGKE